MSTRDWYRYLVKEDIFTIESEDGSSVNRQCRSERLFPDLDWRVIWQKVKLPCFSSSTMSFLFQLLHDLLPTEEWLSLTLGNSDDKCRFNCSINSVANSEHCFFFCRKSREVGSWLQKLVERYGATSKSNILKLNVVENNAVVWIIGNTLHFIWSKRACSKKADLRTCLAQLNTEVLWLKEMHNLELGNQIVEILEQNYHEEWGSTN